MMYVASCPLRISLFGGSSDNPYFVDKYGRGAVISFSSNLKAYITLHEDKMGFNKVGRKYIINYSRREEVDTVDEIQNEIVKNPLDYFGCHPINVTMKSDAYSQGSGLASSSAYTIALIKALSMYYGNDLTDIEICELSYKLELLSNKYAGYQDPYGCGIGGFKRIEFEKGNIIKYDFLSQDLFRHYDMHLMFTGVTRNAEDVSADVTKNLHKIKPLLKTADQAFDTLLQKDYDKFLHLMKKSWEQKKETSSVITQNQVIKDMDKVLGENDTVLAHRLCGAGNGGFFLAFSKRGTLDVPYDAVRVHVTPQGVSGVII
jgi:D-glycero-alpha-D-manno-heptose-7-phosphate kinase